LSVEAFGFRLRVVAIPLRFTLPFKLPFTLVQPLLAARGMQRQMSSDT
jgi:hypothetical protein